MADVLGEAISDYYHHQMSGKLWIHNKYGPREEMPVDTYFRSGDNFSDLEVFAMHLCKGRILDIGAGAGSHSLELQTKHTDVTALEISPLAANVISHRGVRQVVNDDIFSFKGKGFDTLLLLMNGIGLSGSISGLKRLLSHAKTLLKKDGQLIFDSSDIAYLYDGKLPERTPASAGYYGEILYRYEYKKQKTDWFTWLYIDQHTLERVAAEAGWTCEILFEDEYDQYLARLTMRS